MSPAAALGTPGGVSSRLDKFFALRHDGTVPFLRHGYPYLSDRRKRVGGDFWLGVLGRRALCVQGPEATRWLYGGDEFQRAGALPGPILDTLVGRGAVHTLDGSAHRMRKEMFNSLLRPEHTEELVELADQSWQRAVRGWPKGATVALFDEVSRVLFEAACVWTFGRRPSLRACVSGARDMVAMVDGFGSAGPRQLRARLARQRQQDRLRPLMEQLREETAATDGEPAAVVARQRDAAFERLPVEVAVVEVLNLLRPIVAVAWFVTFAMHALHHYPSYRAGLEQRDSRLTRAFVEEVRRFYPMTPALAAVSRANQEWAGHHVLAGDLVVLDVYGQHHSAELWGDADRFRPERFLGVTPDPYWLVAQGGGSAEDGHRCPGELATVQLSHLLVTRLAEMRYELPRQDDAIPLGRVPTRPRSGIRIRPFPEVGSDLSAAA